MSRNGSVLLASIGVLVVGLATCLGLAPSATAREDAPCAKRKLLTRAQLPEGSSVRGCADADAFVLVEGHQMPIPPPGVSVTMNVLLADGAGSEEARVTVDAEQRVSYGTHLDVADSEARSALLTVAQNGCDRSTYDTVGAVQAGDTWFLSPGDGGNPAGATDAEFRSEIKAALEELTTATGCGYTTDTVTADYWINPEVAYEGDFVIGSDGESRCAGYFGTDGWSTVDGGNLDAGKGPVAMTCTWRQLLGGDIVEADVRLNTADLDFTLTGAWSGCSLQYDLRSTLTHEFGHVFGLRDIGPGEDQGSEADMYQTMYTAARMCRTWGRTLAKGDILGMRSLY